MMGKESMDLSLMNIWQSWWNYRKGKKFSPELHEFQYNLEENLYQLFLDLNNDEYKHGKYRSFIVSDNKRRQISVANIRDRVVHRLVYDYLTWIYDKTFIYDAWSCRLNKGLLGAIEKTQCFIKKHSTCFVWRADISKFFDNVDHNVLLEILSLKITDAKALNLLNEIIAGFSVSEEKGMPIGNLTSQIFANIYMNELDRRIKHFFKCKAYLRYGDDFVIFEKDKKDLERIKMQTEDFIENNLKLKLHPRNNFIIKTKQGLKFLGIIFYPNGRTLNKRNLRRIKQRLNLRNSNSYWGIICKHGNPKRLKEFQWDLMDKV